MRHRYPAVGDVPRHYARLSRTRGATVLFADERAYTWADIDEASNRLANALLNAGLRPGAKVATLLPNVGEYVEIMYGLAKAGMVIVPLNSRYVAREVRYGVEFAEASALITTPAYADTVEEILPELPQLNRERVLFVGSTYDRFRDAAPATDPNIDVDDASLYWLPFTSGTTGHPKAAMVTHRALVQHWQIITHEFAVGPDDTTLIAGPFYHSLGFLFGLTGLHAGGRVVIHSSFSPERVLACIGQLGVTMTPMVPTMYTMVLAAEDKDRYDVSSMRKVISAGSPLLTGTKQGLLDLFDQAGLYEFYGSTEIGVATVLRPEDQYRKVRSVGQASIGSEIALLDEDGQPVAPGERGEICKRGALLGCEYLNNLTATDAMYHCDWARSGDLGVLDDEGYLYVVDRTKDMIISGGANVFPSEIEEVISRHAAVLEVAVIGVPDATWGEAIKAVILPRPGMTLDTEEVLAMCERDLASYKKPRSVDIVVEMPKTGTGKILKRALRERYWAAEDLNVR